MATRPIDFANEEEQRAALGSQVRADRKDLMDRLDVVAPSVLEVVTNAGG